jgi:hypothetical protein
MDISLETVDGGPRLRFERRYEHPPARVWSAITEADELRHWFPPGEELQISECEPPHLLAGSWYGDELQFELLADGNGCVLRFCHAFDDGLKAARDAAGWERCFARLGALLAGAPMSEADSLRAWPEAHERYAELFGVDPQLGRRTFAVHQARGG